MINHHSIGPRAEDDEARDFLQGRLTFIGIVISMLGFLAQRMGWTFPQEEAGHIGDWIAGNWDSLAEFAGMVIAFYGRLRVNWRQAQ